MRENWLTTIVVAVICVGLLAYQFFYIVRVDEVAAYYRFGKVVKVIRPEIGIGGEEPALSFASEGGEAPEIVRKAGLFFKLPLVGKVEKCDQRIRLVDGPLVQTQLTDNNQVIPRVYATWRIIDPVAFQRSLKGDEESAAMRLKTIIGNQTQEVFGRYNLDSIVNTDPKQLKFDQIEGEIYDSVKKSLASAEKAYGIQICTLGIDWIALPEDATVAVFGRMEKERSKEAEKLTAEGERIRRTEIAKAQEEADRTLADAEAEAKRIRAEGEAEAARYYDIFKEDADLAIFLRRLEAFENLAKNAAADNQPITFVLSPKTEPFGILEGMSMDKANLSPEKAVKELESCPSIDSASSRCKR